MSAERVVMVHPETNGTTTVTRRAFDLAWSRRGWQLLDDPAKATKDQLVTAAKAAGVHVNPSDTKADIVDHLTQEG